MLENCWRLIARINLYSIKRFWRHVSLLLLCLGFESKSSTLIFFPLFSVCCVSQLPCSALSLPIQDSYLNHSCCNHFNSGPCLVSSFQGRSSFVFRISVTVPRTQGVATDSLCSARAGGRTAIKMTPSTVTRDLTPADSLPARPSRIRRPSAPRPSRNRGRDLPGRARPGLPLRDGQACSLHRWAAGTAQRGGSGACSGCQRALSR